MSPETPQEQRTTQNQEVNGDEVVRELLFDEVCQLFLLNLASFGEHSVT